MDTPLTPRMLQCLCHASRGMTDRDIAAHLGVAEATVHRTLANAYKLLGVRGRAHAVRECFDRGIFKPGGKS
jgi:DNA-binding CsgD family transcriptional regulator